MRRSDDFRLYRLTLRNAPGVHVLTEATDGFTAWAAKLDTPRWARGTGGIEPSSGTTNVTIADSWIRAGDDNIALKAAEGAGATMHVTVRNTHFYNGHGFGIGAQTAGGLSAIRVDGLSIDGADNGLRIKSDRSRGGLVEDVVLANVCMRGVGNPVVLNAVYRTFEGDRLPVYRNITLRNVHALASPAGAMSVTLGGLDAAHRLEATLDNVTIDHDKGAGLHAGEMVARHALLTVKRGNVDPAGDDVRVTGGDGGGMALGCANAFPPFPETTGAPVSAELVPAADETFYVAADGSGDYTSVQAAMTKVPATGGLVLVAPGVYRERVFVRRPHVTLRGMNADATKAVIVYDLSQGTPGATDGFATVRVTGSDFRAENLTFENDFNRTHKQENTGSQARALALYGDRNVLRNVQILGNQNTLYVSALKCGESSGPACEAGRSYFSRSMIAGNVDFIYGDGTAYFDDCELRSTAHPVGFITAQGKHYAGQESLFVFSGARLTADAGATDVYLGRPWRDDAAVIFLDAALGAFVDKAGWREWRPGETHKLDTAFFRTWKPSGPGSPTDSRQLTAAEALRYTPQEVLGGKDRWDPTAVK